MIEPMRRELASRISELFTYIPDGEHLKEKWVLTKMLSIDSAEKPYGNFGTCLSESMKNNRELISGIGNACEEHPEEMEKILKDVAEFDKYRRKDGISIYSFRKHKDIPVIAGKSLAAILGLPYFVFSALVSLPMWTLEKFLRSKIKDRAFRNTASFGVKLGLGTIWFLILAALMFCLTPWYVALGTLLLFVPSYSFFHDYLEGMRRFVSDIRITRCRKLRKRFASILKDYRSL